MYQVLTIHVTDGHSINAKFITADNTVVNAFANAVYPLIVTRTILLSKAEAMGLLNSLPDAFQTIDPQDYIDSIAGETK